MIELSNTGILEKREEGTYLVTTTFTVALPVPGTFYIEVAGKTIAEAVNNLIEYIQKHSEEDELTMRKVKETIFGLMHEGKRILELYPEFSESLCKATWTGEDAVKYSVINEGDEE